MVRLLWLLLLGSTICSAEPVMEMPPMPKTGAPPGFPDVSGGRFVIMDRAEVQAKAGGFPLGPLPKRGEKFKKEPADQVLIGDPEGWMANLEGYRQVVRPEAEILPNTRIALSPLERTPFEKFVLLGYYPEGTTPQGPWTSVSRLFAKPPGELLLLTEWDFGLDGGGVAYFDDGLNTQVGKSRAMFVVTRKDDTTQTIVKWVSGTRQFELISVCKLAKGCTEADEWRDLAASLPEAPRSKSMQQ
jgi:hypothetical protein